MTDLLTAVSVLSGTAATLAALVLFARRARRRGTAGAAIAGAMAAYDEAVHTTAHDTYVEMQAQHRRGLQAPSPARRHPGDQVAPRSRRSPHVGTTSAVLSVPPASDAGAGRT